MSMLSAQVDELRAMAESVGLAMPQAATMMMKAADTIWDLRCKCAELVDERERLFQANVKKNGEVLRLVGENTKLRELCKEWYKYAYELFDECFGEPEANDDFMALEDRTRELGVEVD